MTEQPRAFIAPRRVQTAFADEPASVLPMIVVDAHAGRATLRTVKGHNRAATISDAAAFTIALDRPDLTRVREHPFLLVNIRRRLVALAFGPPQLPNQFRVLANVVRLEQGSAVEIPGEDDTQPSWLLFDAEIGAA